MRAAKSNLVFVFFLIILLLSVTCSLGQSFSDVEGVSERPRAETTAIITTSRVSLDSYETLYNFYDEILFSYSKYTSTGRVIGFSLENGLIMILYRVDIEGESLYMWSLYDSDGALTPTYGEKWFALRELATVKEEVLGYWNK